MAIIQKNLLIQMKTNPWKYKKNNFIPAVRDANIDVYKGEILVIMGLSGSGKSFAQMYVKLIDQLKEKFFSGKSLTDLSQKNIEIRRHKMGMVFNTLHYYLIDQ